MAPAGSLLTFGYPGDCLALLYDPKGPQLSGSDATLGSETPPERNSHLLWSRAGQATSAAATALWAFYEQLERRIAIVGKR